MSKEQEAKKVKKLSEKEYEKKIFELADKGLTCEKIGEALRREGIHPKEYEKRISEILGERYVTPDIKNVEEKLAKVEKHYEKNKQDKRAMRDKERIFAKLRKIREYHNKK